MPRRRPMRQREQQRLIWLVSAFVIAHGGRLAEPSTSDTGERSTLTPGTAMLLPTVFGPMRVVPRGQCIACRFADVAKAVAHFDRRPTQGRLNPRTGRLTFQFGAITAQEAFADFEAAILPLLESREPRTAA